MTTLPRATEGTARDGNSSFGELPVWNLSDLYPATDSPELKTDLEKARAEAKAFEADYRG